MISDAPWVLSAERYGYEDGPDRFDENEAYEREDLETERMRAGDDW